MGTEYHVYAEVDVGGKWVSLNPVFRDRDGVYRSGEIIRFTHSSMSEVFYALERKTISVGVPEDCSAEVLRHFHNLDEMTDDWGQKKTWREYYKHQVFVVDYERAVKDRVRKDRPFKYMYYVPRETMVAFECGEIDEIVNWLTLEEYWALDEEERQAYVYYEWNNWWDEYQMFCEIAKRVEVQMAFFEQVCCNPHGRVRLIVRRC